jgi:electron transport complex protein RnfG
MSELTPAISKNAKILAAFAIVCTAIVGLVHLMTKDRIELQAKQQLLTQLNSTIAAERHNNEIYKDCVSGTFEQDVESVEKLLLPSSEVIYRARMNDIPVAAAIKTVAPDGYNGNIELLIAVNIDGSVSGVRTILHKETPGLGDKIEMRKSDWIT